MRMRGTSCGRQVNRCMLASAACSHAGCECVLLGQNAPSLLRSIQTHPKGTCTAGRPLCVCVWRVLEAPLLIGEVHVVRRSGAHACVPGPERELHMLRSIKILSRRTYLFWLLQQKILGLGLIRTGGLSWYARWYASGWAWVWFSWSTLVPYFRLFHCIINVPKNWHTCYVTFI